MTAPARPRAARDTVSTATGTPGTVTRANGSSTTVHSASVASRPETGPSVARTTTAATTVPPTVAVVRTAEPATEHWRRAVDIRREWLDHGLATRPADRVTTEERLTRVYARHGRRRPRFRWVDSPQQALPLLDGLPTHAVLQQWVMAKRPAGPPPLASDLAAGLSRLRGALDAALDHPDLDAPRPPRLTRKNGRPWPVLPPLEALRAGVPLREVLHQGVRNALRTSLADGFYLPVRAALAVGRPLPVAWYGQQESHWIGYYDVLRRLGLARYRPADEEYLDDWVALAQSGGWWWPGEDTCVVVERPVAIHTEPVPGAWHEQVRPQRGSPGPIEYRDGWRPPLPQPARHPPASHP